MKWRPHEPFNSLSHLAGAVLSAIGLIVLILLAGSDPLRVVGFTVYGLSLVTLYSASALYHGLHVSPRRRDLLRRFDHMAIYLLIAGSYTPMCLLSLPGAWGWGMLAAIWTLALLGALGKFYLPHLPDWASASLYLAMGWMGVVALVPLADTFPPQALAWLLAGGLVYSAAGVIFALERPNWWPETVGHHGVFHVVVLAGSALHFSFVAVWVR